MLRQGQAVLANAPAPAEKAISTLIAAYYDHALVYLTKEMWRPAMALAIQTPDAPFARRYRALDDALTAQVVALMEGLKREGRLNPQVDARAHGEMIFLMLNGLFMLFTTTEAMTLDELNATMRGHVRALTDCIAST